MQPKASMAGHDPHEEAGASISAAARTHSGQSPAAASPLDLRAQHTGWLGRAATTAPSSHVGRD